jgi:hypothetical protein
VSHPKKESEGILVIDYDGGDAKNVKKLPITAAVSVP